MIIYGKQKPNINNINNIINNLTGKMNKIYSTILVSSDHLESISQYFDKTKDQLEDKIESAYNYILEMHYGLAKLYNNNQLDKKTNDKKLEEMNEKLEQISRSNQTPINQQIQLELLHMKSILNDISDNIKQETKNLKSMIFDNSKKINQIIKQEQSINLESLKKIQEQISNNQKSLDRINIKLYNQIIDIDNNQKNSKNPINKTDNPN